MRRRGSVLVLVLVLSCLMSVSFAAGASAAPGDLDSSFGDSGVLKPQPISSDGFEGVNQMSTGHGGIYLLRSVQGCAFCGGATLSLTRFDASGALDQSFGQGGTATAIGGLTNVYMRTALAIDGRGRPLVVATKGGGVAIVRLTAEGQRDPSFGLDGEAALPCDCEGMYWSIAADDSGGATLAGWRTELAPGYPSPVAFQAGVAVFRLRPNGSLDGSFGNGGEATASSPKRGTPTSSRHKRTERRLAPVRAAAALRGCGSCASVPAAHQTTGSPPALMQRSRASLSSRSRKPVLW
jgi:hypothetical protein